MNCINCGQPVPEGAKFCTNCGTRIEPMIKEQEIIEPEVSMAAAPEVDNPIPQSEPAPAFEPAFEAAAAPQPAPQPFSQPAPQTMPQPAPQPARTGTASEHGIYPYFRRGLGYHSRQRL